MKKLSVTLALVLCLVLCALAFASCGKKTTDSTTATPTTTPDSAAATTAEPNGTEPAATTAEATAEATAEPTTPAETTAPETTADPNAHVHTPEAEYWIDQQPTCITPGQKSLYCEECGEQIPGSTVEIPIDPNAHNVMEWTVTEAVDMFHTTGSRKGVCVVCEQTITEDITFELTIDTFADTDKKYRTDQYSLEGIQDGKHFYPTPDDPAGNDLYVEFSILWNESILNMDGPANPYIIGHVSSAPFYFLSPVAGTKYADAKWSGSFEYTGNFGTPVDDAEVDTPDGMCAKSPNYSDYPNIAGPDENNPEWGWHRLGFRVHVELLPGKTGEDPKDYIATSTCYIDGVCTFKISTGADGLQTGFKLFNAVSDGNGGVTYSDADDTTVRALEIPHAKTLAGTNAYISICDLYVTCGKGFVMPVEKVANPTAAKLTVAEGVEVTSTLYFQPVAN